MNVLSVIVILGGLVALTVLAARKGKPGIKPEQVPEIPEEDLTPPAPELPVEPIYPGWAEGIIVTGIVITDPSLPGAPPGYTFSLGNRVRIAVYLQAPEDAIYPMTIKGPVLINDKLVTMNTVIGAPTGGHGSIMYMPQTRDEYTVRSQAQEAAFIVV